MQRNLTRSLGEPRILWRRADTSTIALSRSDVIAFFGRGEPRLGSSLVGGVQSVPIWHGLNLSLCERPTFVTDKLHSSPMYECPERAVMELRPALMESVLASIRGRKAAVLLSGGFDSTLLCVLLAQCGIDFRCYVVEYEGRAGPKEYEYAKSVANRLNVPIKRVAVNLADILPLATHVQDARALPTVCWVAANQMKAATQASEDGCDVMISGFGSDELFGGYTHFGLVAHAFSTKALQSRQTAWNTLLGPSSRERSNLLFLGLCCAFSRRRLARMFPNDDIVDCLESDIVVLLSQLCTEIPDVHYETLMLITELATRTSDILVDELRCAAHLGGIDLQFPFLERNVVGIATRIPIQWKYRFGTTPELAFRPKTHFVDKYVLRLAFQSEIPRRIAERQRKMFTAPFALLLRDDAVLKKIKHTVLHCALWKEVDASPEGVAGLFRVDLNGNPWGGHSESGWRSNCAIGMKTAAPASCSTNQRSFKTWKNESSSRSMMVQTLH